MNKHIICKLSDIKKGVIIHQVNNKHVFNLDCETERKIKEKYPKHYSEYMGSSLGMGNLVKTKVNNKFGIIAMVAQDKYGIHGQYTDYNSFRTCLLKIRKIYAKNINVNYYIPFKIGCYLSGGSWTDILPMIEEICPFITIVYEY